MLERLEELKGNFWTRLNELVDDIQDMGYEVYEDTRRYIAVGSDDEEDVTYVIHLGGTERTIIIHEIERLEF